MARSSRPVQNTVASLLESGKPIAGQVGYIEADRMGDGRAEGVFVKVKAVRLEAKECGIKLVVKPLSGVGEFTIDPVAWIDGAEEIAAKKKRNAALKATREEYRAI